MVKSFDRSGDFDRGEDYLCILGGVQPALCDCVQCCVSGMAHMRIVYGCVTNSLERLEAYVMPSVRDRELVVLWNQTSMSYAYNCILNMYSSELHSSDPPDALILIHDDLEITDPDAEFKFVQALRQPDVELVGVAGGYGVSGLAWWNANTVGMQVINTQVLDFGPRTGDVQSLEGSIMAFGREAIENLRFDEDFDGFHGYDHIGVVACSMGMRVFVADVETYHHTTLGFDSVESAQAWARADERFRRDYGDMISDTATSVQRLWV